MQVEVDVTLEMNRAGQPATRWHDHAATAGRVAALALRRAALPVVERIAQRRLRLDRPAKPFDPLELERGS